MSGNYANKWQTNSGDCIHAFVHTDTYTCNNNNERDDGYQLKMCACEQWKGGYLGGAGWRKVI